MALYYICAYVFVFRALMRSDAQISFNWGDSNIFPSCSASNASRQTSCAMGDEYVSVVWSGFFKAGSIKRI